MSCFFQKSQEGEKERTGKWLRISGKGDCCDSGRWLVYLLKLLSHPCPQESCKVQSLTPHGWGWFEVMFCRRTVAGLGDRWEMNPGVEPSPSFRLCWGAKNVCVSVPRFPIVGWMAVMESNESPLQEKWPGKTLQGVPARWGSLICPWCGTGCELLWATRALPHLPVSAEGQAAVKVWRLFFSL